MNFSKLIDMAKTPEEVKQEAPSVALADSPPKVPLYPWGLCIRLEDETLAKLEFEGEMPSVGDMIMLCAEAKVTSVSENETEDGNGGKKTRRCIELQITKLATEDDDDVEVAIENRKARQRRFYDPDEA